MPLQYEFLQELKFRNNIEEVVSSYVNLKHRGSNFTGLCPFHSEKTPSFTIYPDSGSYYCFGCGAGGDVITFIMQIENLDYMEAVRFLAARAGMSMPENTREDEAEIRRKARILELNREAARYYHSCLLTKAAASQLSYLKQRGLSASTIKRFGLGAALKQYDGLLRHLKSMGYSPQEAETANLAVKGRNGYRDRFFDRVMFPIIDLRGNVIAFGGRILPGTEGAKYLNTSDTPVFKKSRNLYSLNISKNSKADYFILAEGYMDVIALHQAGFDSAVAALGTAFTPEQAKLMSRYKSSVILSLDADEAGQKAASRAIGILNDAGIEVKVLKIPGAKDPDEFIKKFGAERFKGLIEGASNDTEFFLLKAKEKHDTDTTDGRIAFLNEAVGILAAVKNPLERDIYAGRLSDEFDVSKATLIAQIKSVFNQNARTQKKKAEAKMINPAYQRDDVNPERMRYPKAAHAEERLIKILIMHPNLFDIITSAISADDFVTDFNREVFKSVCSALSKNSVFDISYISADYTPAQMGRIVEIMNSGVNSADAEAECVDLIKVIKSEKDEKERGDPSNWSDSDFLSELNRLRENKGGNK